MAFNVVGSDDAVLGVAIEIEAERAKDFAEAKETAFCLSTGATGAAIQPAPIADGKRQACAKGHFFVVLADKDHVFFEYQRKHTSDAVCAMFGGFKGYIQADAHCVYDALFRGDARAEETDAAPSEVGCWAHCRRKFWEAAVTVKEPVAREALLRIRALFKLEQDWASLALKQRHDRVQLVSRPMLDDFFAWAEGVFDRVRDVRGPVATAFRYALRQRDALRRFLDDGRLRLENNDAERALRSSIAVGRKAWLFFGSDDHASAAANIFSLIASAVLHKLDVESYLADIIRVVPYWPRDRYLELARSPLLDRHPRAYRPAPAGAGRRARDGAETVAAAASLAPPCGRLCITRPVRSIPPPQAARTKYDGKRFPGQSTLVRSDRQPD